MAVLANTALSGQTVTYNGVQFGGSDSDYSSLPPQIAISSLGPIYDESGRALEGIRHVLTVRCLFYSTSESNQSTLMRSIRERLLQPGKALNIAGMGAGFGIISDGTANHDITFGPKPLPATFTPLGPVCWEVVWAVEFTLSPCSSSVIPTDLAFVAFNFTTTWNNDFEGMTVRRINGHVKIRQQRDPANIKIVKHVAEETRGNIVVVVPAGYRRTQNSWTEGPDHSRLDFSIEDEQLPGDIFPEGCTLADGELDFVSGDGQGGFQEADISMSMTLKTSPKVARNVAGLIFITAAIAKQNSIQQGIGQSTTGNIFPTRLRIRNRKYDGARITDCFISWHVTASLEAMMNAAGIWEPLTPSNEAQYNLWKASMIDLWDNRGTSKIVGNKDEAVVIDLCDNKYNVTIGQTPSEALAVLAANLPGISCPNVPEDGGWITHDLEVKILSKGRASFHKAAASYIPGVGTVFPGTGIPQPGGSSQPTTDYDVPEYHGYPDIYIGLRFKGLRYKHKPAVPQIVSVGGHPVIDVTPEGGVGVPKLAFDAFCCPVWYVEGVRIYRVRAGHISTVNTPAIGNPNSCENKTVPTQF